MVRNTKAKIARTKKKYGVDLSNEIKIPSLKSFSSRHQFNEFKEKASTFTNRHNLHYQFKENAYGVVASKKDINEITRNVKKVQRLADRINKEHEDKPVLLKGKVIGTQKQEMLKMDKPYTGVSRPKDFDFDAVRNKYDLMNKKERLKKRVEPGYFDKRNDTMRDNYAWLIEQAFNSDGDELANRIKNMSGKNFYEMYLMFKEFDFDLYPSELIEELKDNANMKQVKQMLNNMDRFEEGLNKDLKGF